MFLVATEPPLPAATLAWWLYCCTWWAVATESSPPWCLSAATGGHGAPLTNGYQRLYLVVTETSPPVLGGCDWWLLLMYLVATGNVSGGHTEPSYLRLLSPGGSTVVPGGYVVLTPGACRLRQVATAYVPGGYC
jgi:hypothetical protein